MPTKRVTGSTHINTSTAVAKKQISAGNLSVKSIAVMVLCLLFPPVGVFVLWINGILKTRGRVIITLLAIIPMTLYCSWFLSATKTPYVSVKPIPAVPQAVSAANDGNKTSYDAITLENKMATPEPDPDNYMVVAAEPEPTPNTGDIIVYCTFEGAIYYHSENECTQKNNRQLTVAQAIEEGLKPCTACNPPTT